MTNHGETTGSSENGDISGPDGCTPGAGRAPRDDRAPSDGEAPQEGRAAYDGQVAYEGNGTYGGSTAFGGGAGVHQVTLRTPAELADALPYLLGYRPEDSIVLVALHDRGGRGRFGGRARLGIPANPDDWESVAGQLAHGLVTGSTRRGARPGQIVAYLCQEPSKGESGREVMERLRSLAQHLRVQCGHLDVPVIEALCISDGRFWSYCCSGSGCCPPEGTPMGLPGTSVVAAAATYAGIQVRGTLRELRARLLPLETTAAVAQETALDTANTALIPRILDDASRARVAQETMELAARLLRRFAGAPPVSGALTVDRRDDALLEPDEAATLILGLQDRATRDRAAEWMEGDEAGPALRLWRALARRCVGPYGEHAAVPLTLAGWVAWSSGDELEAREALAMALGADPDHLFARLLHQACNEGLDPESVRRCLRSERESREVSRRSAGGAPDGAARMDEATDGLDAVESDGPHTSTAGDPHGLAARVPEPASASRRRRRTRTAGGSADVPTAAAAAAEGRGTGPNTRRTQAPTSGGTRPTVPGKSTTRPRPSGRTADRRRGARAEGAHSAGDDSKGTG